jgi:hypothetical protein
LIVFYLDNGLVYPSLVIKDKITWNLTADSRWDFITKKMSQARLVQIALGTSAYI